LLLAEALRIAGDRHLAAEFAESGRKYSRDILRRNHSLNSYIQWIDSLVKRHPNSEIESR
jgi:hypothetical protein